MLIDNGEMLDGDGKPLKGEEEALKGDHEVLTITLLWVTISKFLKKKIYLFFHLRFVVYYVPKR